MLSFVPPDGNSRLLSYHIGSQSVVAIPVYIRHNISFRDVGGGRLDITVGPKQTMGRAVSIVIYLDTSSRLGREKIGNFVHLNLNVVYW